jgi:netrin-G3 ligand
MYYTVRNLSPYTEYELFVIAVNNIGRGPPSTPAIVTTGETGEPILLLKLLEVGCVL